MDDTLEQSLKVMERAFRRLENQIPPPVTKRHGESFVFRYKEKSIEQAIVQKLARMISSLAASRVLLEHGYVQEQAAMNRMMDELGDDILFLVAAISNDEVTELHRRFLEAFYGEDYEDPNDIVGTSKSRNMVPRKKIRAYLSRELGSGDDPHRDIAVGKTLSNVFSGFVHSASPQVMEMCAGSPPKFRLFGMTDTPRIEEHAYDSWNYYYRVLISLTSAAKSFGDAELVDDLYAYMDQFEQETDRIGGERRGNSI